MRIRISGSGIIQCPTLRARIEQTVRLGIGSWSSRLRQVTVKLDERSGHHGGLNMECSIHVSPPPLDDFAILAAGSDLDAAVRSAVRQLLRRLKREAARQRVR